LESNGRVESDVLDRLQDFLAGASKTAPAVESRDHAAAAKSAAPEIDAPMPRLPDHSALSSVPSKEPVNPQDNGLQREAKSLEEILRTQSHPTNLIAVKQDNTPVLQNPILDAKVLFLASAEDEFEVLDETPGWVHVRISGLSRGWLRKSLVEMPGDSRVGGSEAIAVPAVKSAESDAAGAPPFSVSSEEIGNFPGEWAALRGKNVKIISLQQATGTGRITSPEEKKQFAAVLFKKESPGLAPEAAGLVLIFDAEDGGMVATTRAALDQWKGGTLSEQAFWKQCFLDPPETVSCAQCHSASMSVPPPSRMSPGPCSGMAVRT